MFRKLHFQIQVKGEIYFCFLYPQVYKAVPISHKRSYLFIYLFIYFQIPSPKHRPTEIETILCIHIWFIIKPDFWFIFVLFIYLKF